MEMIFTSTTPADGKTGHLVLPLFEIVVFPRTRTKIPVGKKTGEILSSALKAGTTYAAGLTVRSGTEPGSLLPEALYTTGSLLKILAVQDADEGYLVCAQAIQRVRATVLPAKDGHLYASCQPVEDIHDLDDAVHAELIGDIRKTIHEISSRFQGSEHFTRPIDQMESIDQIMGYVVPFMPVPLAEKQALLEIASVRQRYITFFETLVKLKENLSFRIEMAQKVSEKVNRSNREAMLREQLRLIQDELNEMDGSGPADAGACRGPEARSRGRPEPRGPGHPELPRPAPRAPVDERAEEGDRPQ